MSSQPSQSSVPSAIPKPALEDNLFNILAEDLFSTEEKQDQTRSALLDERLEMLRKVEKELSEDSWMYEAPRYTGWMCSN
mmetsp:Transcript_2606/g.2879  ORF Transcript_2606/g.2879 Transcript_2606/m.2879 type:complete len:80 (+) Transcript_2606:135-374(+)